MIYVNPTPVRTSINYGINNYILDESVIKHNSNNFVDCNIKPTTSKSKTKFNATMGAELDSQIAKIDELHYIVDSQKNVLVNCNFDKVTCAIQNIILTIADNTKTQIVVNLQGDTAAYYNGAIKFDIGNNVKLELTIVNALSAQSSQFVIIDTIIKNNSIINAHIANFGSTNNCVQFHSNMIGDNSKLQLNSLYYCGKNSKLDLNYIANIYGKSNLCNMDIVGALCANSTKHAKATINFVKGCAKSVGNENEQCLLLEKTAHSVTLPMILCGEENVDGKHATSVGKLDENQLFYLMSRGLTRSQAENLVIRAHFNAIISKINNNTIKNYLISKIDKELN